MRDIKPNVSVILCGTFPVPLSLRYLDAPHPGIYAISSPAHITYTIKISCCNWIATSASGEEFQYEIRTNAPEEWEEELISAWCNYIPKIRSKSAVACHSCRNFHEFLIIQLPTTSDDLFSLINSFHFREFFFKYRLSYDARRACRVCFHFDWE